MTNDMEPDIHQYGSDLIPVVIAFARILPEPHSSNEEFDDEFVVEPSCDDAYDLCITVRPGQDDVDGLDFGRLARLAELFAGHREWRRELTRLDSDVPALFLSCKITR